jgi:hypothetical protein
MGRCARFGADAPTAWRWGARLLPSLPGVCQDLSMVWRRYSHRREPWHGACYRISKEDYHQGRHPAFADPRDAPDPQAIPLCRLSDGERRRRAIGAGLSPAATSTRRQASAAASKCGGKGGSQARAADQRPGGEADPGTVFPPEPRESRCRGSNLVVSRPCRGARLGADAEGHAAPSRRRALRLAIARALVTPPRLQEIDALNDATPRIEVDPQTFEVRADGALLTCEPTKILPMAQRYFLF